VPRVAPFAIWPGPLLSTFYLTTTFDPLLERALNAVRFGGALSTRTQAFFPGAANKDLPARRAELAGVPLVKDAVAEPRNFSPLFAFDPVGESPLFALLRHPVWLRYRSWW